jgi:hypothetical protein
MSTPPPDPMKGFRGVAAGTLVLEAIVVLLALPVVAKLGDGIATWQGILVGVLAVLMIVASGTVGRTWGIGFALGLQVVMMAAGFAVLTLGILGLIFGLVWVYFLWLRRDITRRLAEGTLPSQQQPSTSD